MLSGTSLPGFFAAALVMLLIPGRDISLPGQRS